MNLTRGTGDADLEAARVRSWLAALASVVLLTPVALLVLLIAKDGEARRGWLEVLVVIMAVQTSRTLYLGGTTGPVKNMTPAQLDALGYGYTYSLLWVAGIAVIVGIAAFWIGFSSRQIATAQHTREAVEAGEL